MIRELQIENFKCFKRATLPLSPITIVSGGNGVGKSSIIQALLLLRQAADQLRVIEGLAGPAVSGRADFPVRLNGAYRLALGNSQVVTNSEIESAEIVLGVRSDALFDGGVMAETFVAEMVSPSVTLTCRHDAKNTAAMLTRTGGSPLFAREFHYLIAERNGPRDLSGVSDEGFISTGFAGEFTADAIDRAESLSVDERLHITPGSDLFKVQLEGWMRLLVPGVRVVTTRYPEINRVRMSIERVGVTSPSMSPTNTGFGISYVLPVIASGLLARAGTMLIVENPEAHLHPGAQSAVGQFLAGVASTGVQVIVETHSENVINGVRLAGIRGQVAPRDVKFLFLDAQEGNTEPVVSPLSVDELGELSAWPRGFFDQQTRDLALLMQARRAKRTPSH
ncbi:AAA family ATPase [Mesorhizobium delmotii]|uniref:DUF3696 domain-containing protein n=1 Tax=Mesorhizobium delmotii TaxID=1631247 RepID=A0A2P9AQF5_9HYPH|nr:DUF3696 domain-containing protein [Mesorhizobium delmotii]SJM33312.1 conserved hypothetical protein [Mesorhizobium delmotii]